jgi:hypothetical protein
VALGLLARLPLFEIYGPIWRGNDSITRRFRPSSARCLSR